MQYQVNPKQSTNVFDGETLYKPGDIFPRRINALVASGLLIEVTETIKSPKKGRVVEEN